jgi:hypothetical protein
VPEVGLLKTNTVHFGVVTLAEVGQNISRDVYMLSIDDPKIGPVSPADSRESGVADGSLLDNQSGQELEVAGEQSLRGFFGYGTTNQTQTSNEFPRVSQSCLEEWGAVQVKESKAGHKPIEATSLRNEGYSDDLSLLISPFSIQYNLDRYALDDPFFHLSATLNHPFDFRARLYSIYLCLIEYNRKIITDRIEVILITDFDFEKLISEMIDYG